MSFSRVSCSSLQQSDRVRKQKDQQVFESCLKAEKDVKFEGNTNFSGEVLGTVPKSL